MTPILSPAVNGWQINGTVVWQSGLPYTVTNLNTRSGITGISNERADRLSQNVNLAARTYTNLGIGYIDPAAFAGQALNTLGNSGRNLSSGPSSSFVNMSLFKNFALPESMKLQFRAEFFNLPNHRNFGQPVTTVAVPTLAGSILSAQRMLPVRSSSLSSWSSSKTATKRSIPPYRHLRREGRYTAAPADGAEVEARPAYFLAWKSMCAACRRIAPPRAPIHRTKAG